MRGMHSSRKFLLAAALVASLPAGGCLFRSHKVERVATPANLQTATRDQLVAQVNADAAQVRTINATVDIATSVGGARKGKVTDYTEIRGYILVRKPGELRMIGLFPLVRNTAFDMVSNGETFHLWVPSKNSFYTGHNDVIRPAKQPLENLRPQHIMDALLMHTIDPRSDIAVLEDTTETVTDPQTHKPVDQPAYTLVVLHREGANDWYLARKLVFSREDLRVHRQIVYDKLGQVATDATYEEFRGYDGAEFPNRITIRRPQEEYTITLTVVKLLLNPPLKDEQFSLKQPPDARVVNLDLPQQAGAGKPNGPPSD